MVDILVTSNRNNISINCDVSLFLNVQFEELFIYCLHSNAKHGGGTVIPHLNFSIPCAALEPIFKFSEGICLNPKFHTVIVLLSQKMKLKRSLDHILRVWDGNFVPSTWIFLKSLYPR